MGHVERILPRITLLESTPHLHRVEVRNEVAFGILRVHEVLLLIVDALPTLRETHQLVILGFAERLCQLSRCPRGETVFQRVGGGELELLGWAVAIL